MQILFYCTTSIYIPWLVFRHLTYHMATQLQGSTLYTGVKDAAETVIVDACLCLCEGIVQYDHFATFLRTLIELAARAP
jgi:hypothetical protein